MTVSVVIPSFNRGSKIKPTLDSALHQTRAPLETLVVDDGSTDGTPDWIEAIYAERVRVIRQSNGGVARARNCGWRAAQGEWIAFLDHDDRFHLDKLELLACALNETNDVIVSRWREVRGERVERQSPSVSPVNVFDWLFGWNNPIVSMSVPLVRRAALERVGGFDPRCGPADDWDLWLRLAASGARFAFFDVALTDYLLHEGQQRANSRRMFRAVRKTLGQHPFALSRRPLILWWLVWSGAFAPSIPAYERFKNGDARALGAALRAHPLSLLSPQWLAALGRRALGSTQTAP